ncbi:putative UPF0041 domain protein [Blumeria hordei DH14]|uniref:Mitochondrial pyruvate carrier n=1 Tax=Blumeria graminis f. sp. hordei (strain DH14) TaxID=546991 RepID=N1J5S3_BLUG1|nr:putative UPF0041 domain protein [Blumeria hordei DH14]
MSSILKTMRAAPSFRFTSAQARATFKSGPFKKQYGRQEQRWQSSASFQSPPPGWFKRMWESPIGVKTVHFWAPVMKWSLVLAGISDLYRPAEKLSLTQNLALTATGLIWTRWCFVIKPRNILLATVNFFLGLVGVIQVSRISAYHYKNKAESNESLLHVASAEVQDKVESAESKAEKIIKS